MSILRITAVKTETGYPTSTLYEKIRDGLFVRPVRIGARAVGFDSSEVKAIIAARVAGYTDEQLRELVIQLHAKRATLAPLTI